MIDFIRFLPLLALSFCSGIIDLSLGMGYGFTVTPVMLMLGFTPQEAVPAVLISSFVGGISSSIWNHRLHNVDFSFSSKAFKIASFTAVLGVLGAIVGVFISFNLPARIVSLYIGLIVIASGALVIISKNLVSEFSWNKMAIISLIGSLNKGLTGSGFGPVITTGAMLSGIDEKASVSIQSLSEAAVSLVGFLTYIVMQGYVDYQVAVTMSVGVIFASPLAARIVHGLDGKILRIMVGILALIIGSYTLWKYF
ncbi:MAG: sulfite exporter TauE/SafE family protein [Candidatus Bathyarchaeota archaeon]